MIQVTIPGRGEYRLEHLVLDFNGTLALDGEMLEGVEERLIELTESLQITIATADTFGTASQFAESMGLRLAKTEAGNEDSQKLALIESLGRERTVCIGNGSNDVMMLKSAALGICILGHEGAASDALASSDLVLTNVNDALDLLLKPRRLIASLRK